MMAVYRSFKRSLLFEGLLWGSLWVRSVVLLQVLVDRFGAVRLSAGFL